MKTSRFCFLLVWLPATLACSVAFATPHYLTSWEEKYPTSTLPDRMEVMGYSRCNVCHHPYPQQDPPAFDVPGNCYRRDLATLLSSGLSIAEAIDQLDGVDSDDDGFTNGQEATWPHEDFPGEVGYNMGLVGNFGTDPCADDRQEIVTSVSETPPVPVPAVSTWGMIAMTLSLLVAGTVLLRRRGHASTSRTSLA